MSLAGVDRGTVASTTGGSTTVTISPSANLAASSWGVLLVADLWTNGTDPFVGVTDSLGNTWTSQLVDSAVGSPDTARLRFLTTDQDVASLQTSTVITVTYNQLVQRAALALKEARRVPSTGSIAYRAGAIADGITSSAEPTVTTDAVVVGDLIVAGAAALIEVTVASWAGDGDTLGGAWSSAQIVSTNAADLVAQHKAPSVITAQVFDPVLTHTIAHHYVIGWIRLGYEPAPEPTGTRSALRVGHPRGSVVVSNERETVRV